VVSPGRVADAAPQKAGAAARRLTPPLRGKISRAAGFAWKPASSGESDENNARAVLRECGTEAAGAVGLANLIPAKSIEV
jgi:hypothetical protein